MHFALFLKKMQFIDGDLHSGNILYLQSDNSWNISDLGFCGPADKPSKSIYGNLPYIAPEIIVGKKYTFKSDIYSIAMLMWEISSGQPPFINYKHDDYGLAMDIINGMRPKIVTETPLEYENLMKQCWDADPSKRPDLRTLWRRMMRINLDYQNMSDDLFKSNTSNNLKINKANDLETNYTIRRLFTSKVHYLENLSEPRNATKGISVKYLYQ
jgi:serine/threonine protein kinase